jgi:allantoate deiminase
VGFVTCEEEQSRFDSHMMGARSLLGSVTASELDSVRDGEGVPWRAALAEARAAGCSAPLAPGDAPFRPLFRAALELELHIEQGPVLESEGLELGIVGRIAGYRRLRASLTGAACHSGTTPLALRSDALVTAAEIVVAAESLARDAGEPARVTAGNVRVSPGLYNVVPGACEVWLEVRQAEHEALEHLAALLEDRCRGIAARRGVGIVIDEISRQEPTALSAELAARAEVLAHERGLRHRRMLSGAAHDTMEFARAGVPSLMLFVPSRGGISHAPDEYTSPEHLWNGVRFASDLIGQLGAKGRP